MDVILLERVEKLGAIGDVVSVKNGFARNYLLPNKKALRANETNKKPETDLYFSKMQLKAMSPEQLVESMMKATNAEATKVTGAERRKLYEDWLGEFTVNFGDDEGNEATFNGTVVQALMLMNGRLTADATSLDTSRTLRAVVEAPFLRPEQKIETLYLAVLSRRPSPAEAKEMLAHVEKQKDAKAGYRSVFWALINSAEFTINRNGPVQRGVTLQ